MIIKKINFLANFCNIKILYAAEMDSQNSALEYVELKTKGEWTFKHNTTKMNSDC
jgi:hypothetical protein